MPVASGEKTWTYTSHKITHKSPFPPFSPGRSGINHLKVFQAGDLSGHSELTLLFSVQEASTSGSGWLRRRLKDHRAQMNNAKGIKSMKNTSIELDVSFAHLQKQRETTETKEDNVRQKDTKCQKSFWPRIVSMQELRTPHSKAELGKEHLCPHLKGTNLTLQKPGT